ncbi:hypothetical protein GCM10027405_14540 [Arthrobacter alkaliphilus]
MDGGDLLQTGGIFAAGRRTLDRCHGCAVFLFGDRGDFTNYFTYRCWSAALFTIVDRPVLIRVLHVLLRLVVFIAIGEPKINHCLAQCASHAGLLSCLQ